MKYVPLLHLYLLHAYYPDGRCPDFQVEPTPATQRLLNNYRCILQPLANGIRVLTATDAGASFIPLGKGMIFAFQLVLRNQDFPLFTDLSALAQSTARLYTNDAVSGANPVTLKRVSPQNPSLPQQASRVFANVEITLGDSPPAIASGPGVYQIEFAAKQARWKYYVVTDNMNTAFHITDQDKIMPLTFNDVKDPVQASDSVATALADQYQGLRVLRFMSADAIPCRQQARASLQLFADSTLAVGALPNPSTRNYAIDVELGSLPGASCLFHVIKFLTKLGSTAGG